MTWISLRGLYSGLNHEGIYFDKRRNEEDRGSNVPASAFSIQGVPLDDLTACRKALDEGLLKKKILKNVGEKESPYSPDSGTYVFLETGASLLLI